MRHGLEDDVREPVLVAVGELATRKGKDVCALILGLELALAERPEESDAVAQAHLVDESLQPGPLRPLARQPDGELEATVTELRRREQQRLVPLLLHEAADRQNARPVAGMPGGRRILQLDAVGIGNDSARARRTVLGHMSSLELQPALARPLGDGADAAVV